MADPKTPATPDEPAAESTPNPYVEQPAAAPAAPAAVPGAQPYAYAPQPPKGLSITAMILGIAGAALALCYGAGFLIALAGAIVGHLASKRQPYAKPMWLTGIITGWAGVGISVLWIIGLIVTIVVFGGSMWGLSSYDYYDY